MSNRASRRFRPVAEGMEERCVATAHVAGAGLHALGLHHHPARGWVRHVHPHAPRGNLNDSGGGLGMIRLGLPHNSLDYGVVTVWNNTRLNVGFAVSASTYQGGQFYPFALGPGQVRSFFAPAANGVAPLFQVRFNGQSGTIALPNDNIVFESPAYFPSGTAGWPYAINPGASGGFVLSPI